MLGQAYGWFADSRALLLARGACLKYAQIVVRARFRPLRVRPRPYEDQPPLGELRRSPGVQAIQAPAAPIPVEHRTHGRIRIGLPGDSRRMARSGQSPPRWTRVGLCNRLAMLTLGLGRSVGVLAHGQGRGLEAQPSRRSYASTPMIEAQGARPRERARRFVCPKAPGVSLPVVALVAEKMWRAPASASETHFTPCRARPRLRSEHIYAACSGTGGRERAVWIVELALCPSWRSVFSKVFVASFLRTCFFCSAMSSSCGTH